MFEVGKHYSFRMWIPGTGDGTISETPVYTVNEVALPLLKIFDRVDGETVLNTSSHAFVSAREVTSGE